MLVHAIVLLDSISTLPRIFFIRVTRIRVTSWSLCCKHTFQVLLSIFLCKEITALASTIVSSSRLELPALDCISFTTGVALSLISLLATTLVAITSRSSWFPFSFLQFCYSDISTSTSTSTRNSFRLLNYYQNKGEYNSSSGFDFILYWININK